ncbi:class I SAM-dependent methyltransferase [Inquilinus sp. NPDC058860]|uniref:class I SAM-dependent methyltransferase n=1 Tax=Inquilinus sp. NPDC058860 TaxID=3346652 RepID=UPI0036C0A751
MNLAAPAMPSAHDLLARLQMLIDRGGPEPDAYESLTSMLGEADDLVLRGMATRRELQQIWWDQGESFLRDTMQGFVLLKPHGYAGDFEIIDRIYTHWTSPNPHFVRWDQYFHAQSGAHAVRNRQLVLQQVIRQAMAEQPGRQLHILNLGSGPCRDVRDFIDANPDADVAIDCVDQDANAIAHATGLLASTRGRAAVRFHRGNALRFTSSPRYDLVWSAGLFDYLSDRLFVALLSRIARWLRPGGRIVVGNFSTQHPSRRYMEVVGEWMLRHRDEALLWRLAERAGFEGDRVRVFGEPAGVNLFLDYRM